MEQFGTDVFWKVVGLANSVCYRAVGEVGREAEMVIIRIAEIL